MLIRIAWIIFEIKLSSIYRNFMNFIKNIDVNLYCFTKLTFTNFIVEISISMNIIVFCHSNKICIFSSNIDCQLLIEKNITSNIQKNNLIVTKYESTIYFNWCIRLRNFSNNFWMRLSLKIFNFSNYHRLNIFDDIIMIFFK